MTAPPNTVHYETDAGFLEQAFMEYYSWLCASAYELLRDEELAKDIVHDFFLYCYNKKPVLEKAAHFRKYAFISVRNACLNYRRRSKRIAFEDPLELGRRMYKDEEGISEPDEQKKYNALWEVIGSLPDQRRRIFLLSNRDGLKYAEIAEQLNISINTVKTQIRLAYQFLRKECGWLVRAAHLVLTILLGYGSF
jgi:RNA polymerase sigma-70 factor (ECF subfamily)